MLLAEDGKLSVDEKISKHLANTPAAWDGIAIRHLLTHTSGLGDPYRKIDFCKDDTDEELIARVQDPVQPLRRRSLDRHRAEQFQLCEA